MEGLYHNPVKGPLGWMVANRRSGQFGLEEGAGGSDLLSLLGPKGFEFQTEWEDERNFETRLLPNLVDYHGFRH